MKGLDNVTSIGGDLSIFVSNFSLHVSPRLTFVSLGLQASDSLASLKGLDSVAFIGGDLDIRVSLFFSCSRAFLHSYFCLFISYTEQPRADKLGRTEQLDIHSTGSLH